MKKYLVLPLLLLYIPLALFAMWKEEKGKNL